MSENLSPGHQREIAAMNARVYKMTEADREQWYAEHPVSMFEDTEEAESEILHDLAVLLVTANRAVENNRSYAMIPQRARRRLCRALGIQRLDEDVDLVEDKLRREISRTVAS
jgi:hypothetical protein